ncbi:MAG: hypothetical protein ACRC4M_02600, partial [Mycoplasma sp.]
MKNNRIKKIISKEVKKLTNEKLLIEFSSNLITIMFLMKNNKQSKIKKSLIINFNKNFNFVEIINLLKNFNNKENFNSTLKPIIDNIFDLNKTNSLLDIFYLYSELYIQHRTLKKPNYFFQSNYTYDPAIADT